MLDCVPNFAAVSPGAMVTVAKRFGPDMNWIAASSATPATPERNSSVSVPVPLTCDADASGMETMFCCELATVCEPNTIDVAGSGGGRPPPARGEEGLSAVSGAPAGGAPD